MIFSCINMLFPSVAFIGNNSNELTNSNNFLILRLSPDLVLLFNQFNNASPKINRGLENVTQSKYYDTNQL